MNILLHAANACLVFHLLRRLAIPGAWVAAALFALHPLRVESVAWIVELKDVSLCVSICSLSSPICNSTRPHAAVGSAGPAHF